MKVNDTNLVGENPLGVKESKSMKKKRKRNRKVLAMSQQNFSNGNKVVSNCARLLAQPMAETKQKKKKKQRNLLENEPEENILAYYGGNEQVNSTDFHKPVVNDFNTRAIPTSKQLDHKKFHPTSTQNLSFNSNSKNVVSNNNFQRTSSEDLQTIQRQRKNLPVLHANEEPLAETKQKKKKRKKNLPENEPEENILAYGGNYQVNSTNFHKPVVNDFNTRAIPTSKQLDHKKFHPTSTQNSSFNSYSKNIVSNNNFQRPSWEDLQKQRKNLPVFQGKEEIIQVVHRNNCVIFVGDTACGKTTQIPQFLLEGGLAGNKMIGITQPRRVAAITIAERVSKEVGTTLGGKVGYCVRFENVTSTATKIKYITDGMLLRESIRDRFLTCYSIIILDEAHERTLCTDVLFGVVKSVQFLRAQEKMKPLKVIIMSATLDYDHFSKYFNDAPVYYMRGREYSITILNPLTVQEDYVSAAMVTVFQIHQEEDEGDILVFCTGEEEINSMVREAIQTSQLLPSDCLTICPCPLYAALPSVQQLEVFKKTPKGCRKVIFATNIAETSVTIPGIKYVIDTGMVKARTYDPVCGLDLLKVQRISKAQANQRSGRSGRESHGFCYRLYTLDQYKLFEDYAVPEIQRCSLSGVILQIVAMGVHNIRNFDFLDKPSDENIEAAIVQLKLLGALDEDDDSFSLTECGREMVNFPLDPRFSKVIICSKDLKCTDEVLTIISLLSVESVFYTPSTMREEFTEVRKKFISLEGDHVMLLNVYKAYRNSKGNQSWCYENFVNAKNMQKAIAIRKQLSQLCQRAGIPNCSCGPVTSRIRKCLTAGLFMNSAELQTDQTYKTLISNQKVDIHPSSCLFKSKPYYCIYTELIQTSKCYMRNISVVEEDFLKETAPDYFRNRKFLGLQLVL